jgi:hypothetical protein
MLYPMIGQIHTRRDVESTFNRQVVVCIPSQTDCPVCGWDEFTQSGKDVACTTCNGTGKVTTWQKSRVSVRVMWVDEAAPRFGLVTSGDIGDVWLSAATVFKDMFEKVEETDNAYILVDNQTVKPISVGYNEVQGRTSVDVRCKIIKLQISQ